MKTIAEVAADRSVDTTPGRRFTEACAAHGAGASVEFDVTITDSLLSSRRKPRYPARNLFKIVDLNRSPRRFYWHESPPRAGDGAVNGADVRREAASRFHKSEVPELHPTTAWVQVPPDLWNDAETFESFISYRLIVRLATAENVAILSGPGGLLHIPGIARLDDRGPFASPLLAACNEVEQMGGTADGMIINPHDYYRLLGQGRLIQDLEDNGVFISRTRLVPPRTAVLGDFGHGAILFDAGRSVIRFAEPPPGTFAEPGLALMAEIYERVAINLPSNFFFVAV